MQSWFEQIKKNWLLLAIVGTIWLFWQLFTDELAGIIREYIPEGGIIMYGITHPYIIMPILLILFGLYLYVCSKQGILSSQAKTATKTSPIEDIKADLIRLNDGEREAASTRVRTPCPEATVVQINNDITSAVLGTNATRVLKTVFQEVLKSNNADPAITLFKKIGEIFLLLVSRCNPFPEVLYCLQIASMERNHV